MVHRSDALANITEAMKKLLRYAASGELGNLLQTHPRVERPSFQSQRRLTATEITQLIADYQAGDGSSYDLAARYGLHRQTVAGLLKDHGLSIGRTPLTQAETRRAQELRAAGWSANRIGVSMQRDPKTIRATLANAPDPDA